MPTVPIYQVDAFTNRPFAGNPAAVCIMEGTQEDAWLQAVAAEMNLAETAFLLPDGDEWLLRWFTPTVEIDLCGHATLASAQVLWETGRLEADKEARFFTRSGLLTATQEEGWITLNFPTLNLQEAVPPPGLLEALRVEAVSVQRSQYDYLIEVASESLLRALKPNMAQLEEVAIRGVIVTSLADAGSPYDFVSRFFAPAAGIPEDPATGSAHCALTPYWSAKLGKIEMEAFQASPRGGHLRVRLEGERVALMGQAVMVLEGTLSA